MLFRCFYCDRTTSDESKVVMGANGKLACRECAEYERSPRPVLVTIPGDGSYDPAPARLDEAIQYVGVRHVRDIAGLLIDWGLLDEDQRTTLTYLRAALILACHTPVGHPIHAPYLEA